MARALVNTAPFLGSTSENFVISRGFVLVCWENWLRVRNFSSETANLFPNATDQVPIEKLSEWILNLARIMNFL